MRRTRCTPQSRTSPRNKRILLSLSPSLLFFRACIAFLWGAFGCLSGVSERRWVAFKVLVHTLGDLGPQCGVLGMAGDRFGGVLWAHFGTPWTRLGCLGDALGPLRDTLGSMLACLGIILGHIGTLVSAGTPIAIARRSRGSRRFRRNGPRTTVPHAPGIRMT